MTAPPRPGSDEPCPHCGARAGVVPDGPLGQRCALCGGPRIVVEPAVPRPGSERALLAEARTARMKRAAWGVGAGIATVFAAVMGLVTVIAGSLFDFGALGWTIATVMTLGPALLAGFGWRRVSGLTHDAADKLHLAEERVATEILQIRGSVEATELARMMRVSEDRAYELLAHGEVAGMLSNDRAPDRKMRVDDALLDDEDEEEALLRRQQR
jgi:hypothetical protein